MGKSPAKWVKNILRGKRSSKSYPSKKAADENNAPVHPQASPTELSATSTLSNSASRNTTTKVNTELEQTISLRASYENDTPVAANQTNESCATESNSLKEAKNLGIEEAATEMQAALRGFMARQTYHSLKGIIRLQALIRGHLVRRQALATLHSVRGIVKLQAVARGRRIRRSYTGLQVRLKCPYQEVDVTETSTFSSSISLGKQSSNAFANKILASSVSALPLNIQYDPDEPNSAPNWLERWSSSHFWGSAAHQKETLRSNSKLQGNKAVKPESSASAAPRHEARKVGTTNVVKNSPHSSLNNGKSKRNNRKNLVQHVETGQDNPENELERVKRSLRKISLNNKEASGKSESVADIPKKSTRNVSVSKSEAATEELNQTTIHTSNSEILDIKEHVLTDIITDETNPSDTQPQKPEMEAELESLEPCSGENGVDVEKSYFANEEKVSREEDSLEYDQKSLRKSVPAKQEYNENSPQNARTVPSYMAATASAKAKLRGLGSPKVADEGEDQDAVIRRHSLPTSTNGKLSTMSPRIQKVSGHSNGKDRSRGDRSLTSSRDGHGKVLKPDWRR